MLTKQELAKNFTLNIEKERLRRGLTQSQMAEQLEMSLSGYKKMISGATVKIDLHTMYLLYRSFGKNFLEMIDEADEDAELMLHFNQLSEAQQKYIEKMIEIELALTDSQENADDYITVFIPTGNMEDGMIFDSANYTKVNASAYRKKFGSDLYCGIQVTSDHLHPVYNMGDILLICHKAIREGDTGIFLNKATGRVYIRKLLPAASWVLEPINDYGEQIVVDRSNQTDMQNWVRFGYVLTKMRTPCK